MDIFVNGIDKLTASFLLKHIKDPGCRAAHLARERATGSDGRRVHAGLSLRSRDALRWSKKWCYGDPEAKFVIADLMVTLEQGARG